VKAACTPQLLIDDMSLAHEAKPEGVPDTINWSAKPRIGAGSRIPDGWSCITMWGQIYPAQGGDPGTNVRVEIRELSLCYLSKKSGKWVSLQRDSSLDGAAYRQDFANDEAMAADLQRQADGTVSVKLTPGRNFHFWPTKAGPARATIDPTDIAALASSFKARLVTADPAKPDDRAKAKVVGSCGGDYWRALDSKWKADWSNNGDWALGRFRYLSGEWQVFTACTADAETIRANPPPLSMHRRFDALSNLLGILELRGIRPDDVPPARLGPLDEGETFGIFALSFETQSEIEATLENIGMLRAEHALPNGEHRPILLLGLGRLALGSQRGCHIGPTRQGIRMFLTPSVSSANNPRIPMTMPSRFIKTPH
jgi:hypothetical protein